MSREEFHRSWEETPVTLLRNYDWYVSHRATLGVGAGLSHRVPWKQGALRVLKQVF